MSGHLHTTRRPQPEARRQFVHGPLVPLERPEGEPPLWAGVIAIALPIVAVVAAVVAFTGG